MQPCSVFCKSPVNVLSYFHDLKKEKRKNIVAHLNLWNEYMSVILL